MFRRFGLLVVVGLFLVAAYRPTPYDSGVGTWVFQAGDPHAMTGIEIAEEFDKLLLITPHNYSQPCPGGEAGDAPLTTVPGMMSAGMVLYNGFATASGTLPYTPTVKTCVKFTWMVIDNLNPPVGDNRE